MASKEDSLGRGPEQSDQGAESIEEVVVRMRDGMGSADPWSSWFFLHWSCVCFWRVVTSKSGEASGASPGGKVSASG